MSQRNCRPFLNPLSLSISLAIADTYTQAELICAVVVCQLFGKLICGISFISLSLMRLQSKRGKHWSLPFGNSFYSNINNSVFCSLFPECMRPFRFTLSMVYATLLLILLQLIYDFPHINRPIRGGTLSSWCSPFIRNKTLTHHRNRSFIGQWIFIGHYIRTWLAHCRQSILTVADAAAMHIAYQMMIIIIVPSPFHSFLSNLFRMQLHVIVYHRINDHCVCDHNLSNCYYGGQQ